VLCTGCVRTITCFAKPVLLRNSPVCVSPPLVLWVALVRKDTMQLKKVIASKLC